MLYRHLASQDQIDAEYNVETRIPDARSWLERFVRDSEATRRDLDCLLDVPFGPTRAEYVDIFPAADPAAPIVVFVHGGYWRRLSAKEFSFVARGLVGLGITVVVSNYALCPAVSIAEITRQTRAAMAWVYDSDNNLFAGDRERIFIAGHSAGGHQVARALVTDWVGAYDRPANLIKGGYALSGLFDLAPLRYSWLQPMIQLDGDLVARESPQLHIPTSAPALIADVGGIESAEFHRQSQEFIAAWQAAGLDGKYVQSEGCHHFSVIEGFGQAQSDLSQRLCSFIEQCDGRDNS